MNKKAKISNTEVCKARSLAIKDTMGILTGKWKFHILGTLMIIEKIRFMELLREVDGIGAKMLSKELQDLELNQLIERTVLDTKPITVEYKITEYGRTLGPIIDEIARWGTQYREMLHSNKDKDNIKH